MNATTWPPSEEDLLELALDQADTHARVDLLQEPTFLGAVLCADVIERVWFLLSPADFYDGVHAVIWTACLRLRSLHHVQIDNLLRECIGVDVVADRLDRIARHFVSGDADLPVMYAMAAAIRRASVERAAARLKRRSGK